MSENRPRFGGFADLETTTMTDTAHSHLGRFKLTAVGLLLLALAACTQTLTANVSRFQSQLPPPAGQTVAVVADDPAKIGGIEFGQYASLVDSKLAALGYHPVADPAQAELIVHFDYGVDHGRERVESTGFHDPFWGPWYGYGPYWGGGWRGRWAYGWYDPWFDVGPDIDTYTVYTSFLSLKIDRRVDGKRLFEGKAEAVSTSNRLQYLVPNLVEAMFTGFPGDSGQTVRITVAPDKNPTVRPAR
jgi:hypothetical protein